MQHLVEIWNQLVYFSKLTLQSNVIWPVLPLFLATILIIIYFGIYKEEHADWNTHLSNTFVLMFVSIALLRYIYGLGEEITGYNYFFYLDKTLATVILFAVGIIMVRFNFEHLLPNKITKYMSSPLSVNLLAYAIILFVHAENKITWHSYIALLIMIIILFGVLLLLGLFTGRFSKYVEKEKAKERRTNVKEAAFQIKEMKNELKRREKELKQLELKKLEKQKKEAVSLKKIIKKKVR